MQDNQEIGKISYKIPHFLGTFITFLEQCL